MIGWGLKLRVHISCTSDAQAMHTRRAYLRGALVALVLSAAATSAPAQERAKVPDGCAPIARVDWVQCAAIVLYQCEGEAAWIAEHVVGASTNFAMSYDASGSIIRQLGTGGSTSGPVAEFSDPFEYEALLNTGEEEMAFTLGSETGRASFTMDPGFRFHSVGGLLRADMIGRTTQSSGQDYVYDTSAYFLPDVPVAMVNEMHPIRVLRIADAPDLAEGPSCS